MPQNWGDYELVDESKLPARPDYTALAREMTQPAPPRAGLGTTMTQLVGRQPAPSKPAGAEPAPQERYRPGSLLGKVIASLSNAVPGGGLLSDETIRFMDDRQGDAPPQMSGNGDIPARPEDREIGKIYVDKRGMPRRWLGDSWAPADASRETTGMEKFQGAYNDLIQGTIRAPEALIDLGYWAKKINPVDRIARALVPGYAEKVDAEIVDVTRFFENARSGFESFKPEAYKSEQATPVVHRDAQGNITGLGLPSTEQVLGTTMQSAPQIPQMLLGGGAAKNVITEVLPNSPKLAAFLGYGSANAATVAPNAAEQARVEALDSGKTPEQAAAAANVTMGLTAPLTVLTGGAGEGMSAVQGQGSRNLLSAIARGFLTDAPTEGIEESGQSLIGDIAQGRQLNLANALEQGIQASVAGGLPGAAVGGKEYLAENAGKQRARPQVGAPVETQAPATQPQSKVAPTTPETSAEAAPKSEPVATPVEKATVPPEETAVSPAESPQQAPARPDMDAATKAIDTRLAALDESARAALPESKVSELNAERQQLDDLVREQDQKRSDGIIQPPAERLTAAERAQADARRAEIAAEIERHRAARSAADQAARLRQRLDSAGDDAALYKIAQEIDPTLGTAQAQAFRTPTVDTGKINKAPTDQQQAARTEPPRADASATPSDAVVPPPASPAPAPPAAQVQTAPTPSTDASAPTPPPAADAAPPPSREPAAAPAPEPAAAAAPAAQAAQAQAAPERQTSIKNAVTDAERIAEGRDPIIAAARQSNRETIDAALQQVRANPRLGRETAARLAGGGKASLQDEAVLLVHKVDLRKQRDAAAEIAQDPNASEEARAQARREYDDVVQQIDEVDQAAKRVGTESGRMLQLRRRMIAEDYSLPALERKLAMAVDRPVTEQERGELRKMADKIADLERKLGDAERAAADSKVADLLAKLMKGAPGPRATMAQRRAAAEESRAALTGGTRPRASMGGEMTAPAAVRRELARSLGAEAVRKLEASGLLRITAGDGGRTQAEWDGQRITAFEGNIPEGQAFPVLLHEVTHAKIEEILGADGFAKAQTDFDALLAKGDPIVRAADARVRKELKAERITQADVPHERLAYLVEEAANGKPSSGVIGLVQRILSAFRRWAATSSVVKAMARVGVKAPTLRPADFVAYARQGVRGMVADAENPRTAEVLRLTDRVQQLERQLRTDSLTGLPNKEAFDADASLGWGTVVAIDMDGLKRLNDSVGHEAADEVLRALGDELRAASGRDARFYRRSGDEFAGRFRDPAEAERVLADLQQSLDGLELTIDVSDDAGDVRSYTYQGIGISYGTGSSYEAADAAANRQKADRLASGAREAPRADGPSRRLRESPPRPGGRRAGDPPPAAVEAAASTRRSSRPEPPAGVDPIAFFHLVRMGAFHVADGARDQAAWTARMEADLGAAAAQYRGALPAAFQAAQAQVAGPAGEQETVAEAMQAIGDKRRPRDIKRVIRAVVGEGMRGEAEIIQAAGQALGMEDADVRALFVQADGAPRTETEARRELADLRKLVRMQEEIDRLEAGQPKPAAGQPAKDSPAVAARRAELEQLREKLREDARPDEETRYQQTRTRDLQRRIAELEERIRAGDFAKRERTERALTTENQRLRYELESTRERFHRYALEAEFNSRTPIGKLFGNTLAGINFARAIMTSLDLSAVLRQGGFITLGNPARGLRAFPGSLRAAISEKADFEQRQEIENRPNAPLYRKYGLELTSIGGDALSRTEEAYASRWVDKLPGWAGGGLIRGSGRAYTSFLNRIRADSFDAMVAALARKGADPTPAEAKAIANYINVATGRGRVLQKEAAGETLNAIFFAPRLVASRFQLLAGQPLYGGSMRTRNMIAQEYARFLMGATVAITLALMMRDDDDETKAIELDPRSANFGKVRFGNTFLDPLVGLAQVTVFLSRVATGETRTTTTDALRPLRDENRLTDVAPGLGDGVPLGEVGYGGSDVPDVIFSFLRSKLAPVPGAVVNVVAGENMIGEKVTPLGAARELVTPMSVGNIVDVMESQGMARGTAINLLGILGMSVQYRKSDAERQVEAENGVAGMMGVGQPAWDSDGGAGEWDSGRRNGE